MACWNAINSTCWKRYKLPFLSWYSTFLKEESACQREVSKRFADLLFFIHHHLHPTVAPKVTDPAAQAKEGRAFFDAFAKENGFDPLEIDNWYSLKLSLLAAKKVEGPFPPSFLSFHSFLIISLLREVSESKCNIKDSNERCRWPTPN